MKNFKIALVHCPKSYTYKLMKYTKGIEENDLCVMWVFDSPKITLARKIMRNLNIAQNLNPVTGFSALA